MGIVPWVRRDASFAQSGDSLGIAALEAVPEANLAMDFGERPLHRSDYQGVGADVHGLDGSEVLLVFDAPMNGSCIDLDPSNESLLLDMLGAIALEPASVARCLTGASVGADPASALQNHIPATIKAVLHLVTSASDIDSDNEVDSRTESTLIAVPVWRLPHPDWIKRQPALKRRAWNILKAVKRNLENSSTR